MSGLGNFKLEDVQRNLAVMKQFVKELHPNIEVERGPFHDVVLYYSSIFATANQQQLQDVIKTLNLSRIMKDPSNASPALVDRALGNWLITRKHGAVAKGVVTFVLDAAIPLVVPSGYKLTAQGCTFKVKDAYVVRTTAAGATLLDSDRVLSKLPDGTWSFSLPVVAIDPGVLGNLRRNTKLRGHRELSKHVKRIVVMQDFSEGADEESNAQMLRRLSRISNSSSPTNRTAVESLLGTHPKFARALDVSIIGFGDPEMHRDRRTLWPGSIGGRCDVYIRPPGGTLTKEVILPAILSGQHETKKAWEIEVSDNCYNVLAVRTVEGIPCGFKEISPRSSSVVIENPIDAVYSCHQKLKLEILENCTAPFTGNKSFVVTLQYVDGIKEAQEHMSRRDYRSPAGDVLVKAAVPCFTHVIIEVLRHKHDPQCNVNAIKEAVASLINGLGFTGSLSAAAVIGAAAPHLDGTMLIKGIKMKGEIRRPDATTRHIKANDVLVIPYEPTQLVTARTTAFFQDPNDVEVRVVILDLPDV